MKGFVKVFTTVLLIAVTAIGLTACNKKGKSLDLSANISYAETHKYVGSDENFCVTVTIGIKEQPLIADGAVTAVREFATVAVMPLKVDLATRDYSFAITADGGEFSGALSRDVVTHAYVAEVNLNGLKDKLTAVKVYFDKNEMEIPIADKIKGNLSYAQALDVATAEFKAQIDASMTDGVLPREIFVKLIRDKRNPDSPYYWYVSFIAADSNYWAILLNPETGEVVSKKA